VEATTRPRALWLVVVELVFYVLGLGLIGIGAVAGPTNSWLLPIGFLAMSVGMGAAVLLRLAIVVADPAGRAMWRSKASFPSRAFWSLALVARVAAIVAFVFLAATTRGR
jgi:hypothetical protein